MGTEVPETVLRDQMNFLANNMPAARAAAVVRPERTPATVGIVVRREGRPEDTN
jgi:hypothetical protein